MFSKSRHFPDEGNKLSKLAQARSVRLCRSSRKSLLVKNKKSIILIKTVSKNETIWRSAEGWIFSKIIQNSFPKTSFWTVVFHTFLFLKNLRKVFYDDRCYHRPDDTIRVLSGRVGVPSGGNMGRCTSCPFLVASSFSTCWAAVCDATRLRPAATDSGPTQIGNSTPSTQVVSDSLRRGAVIAVVRHQIFTFCRIKCPD